MPCWGKWLTGVSGLVAWRHAFPDPGKLLAVACSSPPSDTLELPMLRRVDVRFGPAGVVARVVGEPQAKLGVDLGLVGWIGLAQHGQQV